MAETHIVFGGGSLGNAVARTCVAHGHTTKVVTRSGRAKAPAGATAVQADATDAKAVEQVCAGASVAYNCAAPPYTDWLRAFAPLQAGIVNGAAAAGARLVSAESYYPYGAVSGPMTEETPFNPCSKKGELRARLNRELLDAHKAGKIKVALGLGPDYYGPEGVNTTAYGGRVFGHALAGKACDLLGDLNTPHTFIFVDDFAAGLVALGETPSAMGQSWHLPCPPALTQNQMIEIIGKALGKPVKARAMPSLLLKLLGVFMPIMRELGEMEYIWKTPLDFRCDKFKAAFPTIKPTPHDVAIAQTLAWFKTNNILGATA